MTRTLWIAILAMAALSCFAGIIPASCRRASQVEQQSVPYCSSVESRPGEFEKKSK